jgi:hypothetical protein
MSALVFLAATPYALNQPVWYCEHENTANVSGLPSLTLWAGAVTK